VAVEEEVVKKVFREGVGGQEELIQVEPPLVEELLMEVGFVVEVVVEDRWVVA
jgi:hypothetical protein